MDYRCPSCDRKQFEGERGVRVQMKCPRCGRVNEPAPDVGLEVVTLRCSGCGHERDVISPAHVTAYCAECGRHQVEEIRREAVKTRRRTQYARRP